MGKRELVVYFNSLLDVLRLFFVVLPHGAMGWSAVCFVVFPDHSHLHICYNVRQ